MQWFAQAPSNIALIKYMGKKEGSDNIPANTSLSYTLPNLISSVSIEKQAGKLDFWEPLDIPGGFAFSLSQAAQTRYLNHLNFLKKHFHYEGGFLVRSCNNFPLGSGLASSASSFAALTKCAIRALCDLTGQELPSILQAAQMSRAGSGSSCRSFFAPWALWHGEIVENIELPYSKLLHQVIIISHEEKTVSSSEAHRRIISSPLYPTRVQRAEENLRCLLSALQAKDWPTAFHICWREFHDMHQLFTTCAQPFSYISTQSEFLLQCLKDFWDKKGDGPIVTMDAGPNIHLLYRPEQKDLAQSFKQTHLVGNFDVL